MGSTPTTPLFMDSAATTIRDFIYMGKGLSDRVSVDFSALCFKEERRFRASLFSSGRWTRLRTRPRPDPHARVAAGQHADRATTQLRIGRLERALEQCGR